MSDKTAPRAMRRREFLRQCGGWAAGVLAVGSLSRCDGLPVVRQGQANPALLSAAAADIYAEESRGPLEWWRHGVGQGGINPSPLPQGVQDGLRDLHPRLVRVFLQEFFRIYTETGRFDWSRLDPYLESFARNGAKVVASICIKPKRLFQRIDQKLWRPTSEAEWQGVVSELVSRYSVQRPIVSHWEILNEPDIGENGGTPFLISDPRSYFAFYRFTVDAILRANPEAKVGGPAATFAGSEPLPGLIEECKRTGVQLDFVSWHRYDDDPKSHAAGVEQVKKRLLGFPGHRPGTMVTEWSKSFDPVSIEELAFHPSRAAIVATTILAFMDSGLDWSFYYHLWDQYVRASDFKPFMSDAGVRNMVHHWNEVPHRFGLFGVNGEVRPQYFVFWMLGRMGSDRISASCDQPSLRILAARSSAGINAMLVNSGPETAGRLVTLKYHKLTPGVKRLTVYRIDSNRQWSEQPFHLNPTERRTVETADEFSCQVVAPGSSVTFVKLRKGT